ncbi:MAG: hypothetical protein IPN76_06850 [Saprospiraceae bacterium]|nr:hypothetical protein [Saprospiraceae bacterium]
MIDQDYAVSNSKNQAEGKKDAITIWYEHSPNSLPFGENCCAPSKRIVMGGNDVTPDEVIIHEMGHCLGLMHLFGDATGTTQQVFCSETKDLDSCHWYCDLVCDTPFKNGGTGVTSQADCSESILPDTTIAVEAFRNYMSYNEPRSCRSLFTDEQIRRMRYHLKNHPLLDAVVIFTTLPGDLIPLISGDIIVESGTHSITTPIQMLPGAKIVVKRGKA